jgi:hypothetical protein
VPVNRGPSYLRCSTAIVAAAVADIAAREQREEAHRRRSEEAFRAVQQRPEKIALVSPHSRSDAGTLKRRASRFIDS